MLPLRRRAVPPHGTVQPELVLESATDKNVEQWSPDGKYVVFNSQVPDVAPDVWGVSLSGKRDPIAILNSPFIEDMAQISPNGRWIAYTSNEAGANEVYVQGFSVAGTPRGKWRVSTDGGVEPQWRADGKELYYVRGTTIMAVEVKTDKQEFEAGQPKPLFERMMTNIRRNRFIASRDGQRFLVLTPPDDQITSDTHVIVNWHARIIR